MEQVETPDLTELRKLAKAEVDQVLRHGWGTEAEDSEHFIYEAAMKALYGKDVFLKLNAMTDEN